LPRLPVDGTKVVEHRITFGTKERQQLDQLTNSIEVQNYTKSFENLADPIVEILKDTTALIAVLTILAGLGVLGASFAFLFAMTSDTTPADILDAFLTQHQQAMIAVGGSAVLPGQAGLIWRLLTNWLELLPQEEGEGGQSWWQSDLGSQEFNNPANSSSGGGGGGGF